MIIDIMKMHRAVVHLYKRAGVMARQILTIEQRLTKLEEPTIAPSSLGRTATGVTTLQGRAEQPRCYDEPIPQTVAKYYGSRFVGAIIGEDGKGLVSRAIIETRLEEIILAAAKQVRQEQGLRDWDKEPETATEVAARCVHDVQTSGYLQSGSMADGVYIEVRKVLKERRSGYERRHIHLNVVGHVRRHKQRRQKNEQR